jgi:hypothetical protein
MTFQGGGGSEKWIQDIHVKSVPASVGGSTKFLASNLDLVMRKEEETERRADDRAGHPRINGLIHFDFRWALTCSYHHEVR